VSSVVTASFVCHLWGAIGNVQQEPIVVVVNAPPPAAVGGGQQVRQ